VTGQPGWCAGSGDGTMAVAACRGAHDGVVPVHSRQAAAHVPQDVTFTRFGDRELAIADTIAARLGAYADEYDLEGIAQELIVELDDGSVEVSVLPHDCFFAVAARYARDAIPAGGWRS
jgi:hypothetical protein